MGVRWKHLTAMYNKDSVRSTARIKNLGVKTGSRVDRKYTKGSIMNVIPKKTTGKTGFNLFIIEI